MPPEGGADVRARAANHREWCHWLRAHPTEGDEGALCDCGAFEEAYVDWLTQREEADRVS